MTIKTNITTFLLGLFCCNYIHAQEPSFTTGPLISEFGENALIAGGLANAEQRSFKVLFDLSHKNETDEPLRQLNSVARFINMHVRAGVAPENIKTAVVVHGGASFELLNNAAYQKRFGKPNPSADLVQALLKAGSLIELCGQSAAYHQIDKQDLAAGVAMSLSAMTANALLQQQGFTLNPF